MVTVFSVPAPRCIALPICQSGISSAAGQREGLQQYTPSVLHLLSILSALTQQVQRQVLACISEETLTIRPCFAESRHIEQRPRRMHCEVGFCKALQPCTAWIQGALLSQMHSLYGHRHTELTLLW